MVKNLLKEKEMKLKNLVLGAILLSAMTAKALPLNQRGGIDGGGGNALVCYDSAGKISTVRMFDLYEGEILYSRNFSDLTQSFDDKIKNLTDEIYGQGQFSPLKMRFDEVKRNLKLLPAGVRLKPIKDSGHIFIPRDCKVEQLAHYYNSQNIYVVSDFYNKMSELDKFSLVLHEAIYSFERENGVENSRYARRVVSHLLSDNFVIENIYDGIDPLGELVCTTWNLFDPTNNQNQNTAFYAKRNGDRLRVQFTTINGHNVYTKKYYDVHIGQKTFPVYDGDPNINFKGSEFFWFTPNSTLDSSDNFEMILANDDIDIGGKTTYMLMKYKGFDPGDEHAFREFSCAKIMVGDDNDD